MSFSISSNYNYAGTRALNAATRALSASPAPEKSSEDTSRAAQLTRQLEDNLSSRLSRIRQQISLPGDANNPEGTGQLLDIHA